MKLEEQYKKEILPKLKEEFKYKNDLQAPRLLKAVINVGFGRHAKDKAYIDNVINSLARISGQQPVLTAAKKSVSAFKIRTGMKIGAKVTLHGSKMYDFVEKLIKISFPRVRDFRGISESCVDEQGNLNVGFKEHLAFPEVGADDVENVFGLEVSVVTATDNRDAALKMFKMMQVPFKKEIK